MEHHTLASPPSQDPASAQLLYIVHELLRCSLWHNAMTGRLLEELAEVKARQQGLYDLLVPRFNQYFRDDFEARLAWIACCELLEQPNRPFPGDLPSAREDERDAI